MGALIQGSSEWLEMRKKHIGASDAPIILGVSPWKTPYQLWQEKLSYSVPTEKTANMQRGLDLEETARELFTIKTGIKVKPDVLFSNKYSWQMASLDGIDVKKEHIVEIKCPGQKDHQIALQGKIPDHYYPQLQHQLAVADLDMAFYFSFDGIDGTIIEVKRNDEYIGNMIELESSFYQNMVNLTPPEYIEKDYILRDDDEWSQLALEWKEFSYQIKILEEKQKQKRERLILLAGQSNVKGSGISVSKISRKGNVDYSKIPELKNLDIEKYRKKSTEMWVIR